MASPRFSVWLGRALAVPGGCAAGSVVFGDGFLDELAGERRLLGVGPVVGRERRLHPGDIGGVVEVHFRHLLQAAGRALLHAHEASLAVRGADRVVPVLPGVAHDAHVRADDVAVVAAVADPAAHAAVGLRDRLLAAVGQGDLHLLAAAALPGRGERGLDPRSVPEVGRVQALVRHHLDLGLGAEFGGGEHAVDVARRPLAVAERVHHHRRAAHDVAADEHVALDPAVLVGGDDPAVAEVIREPLQLLHLPNGDHDGVAGDLALGAGDQLRPHAALGILAEPGVADHGPGDLR